MIRFAITIQKALLSTVRRFRKQIFCRVVRRSGNNMSPDDVLLSLLGAVIRKAHEASSNNRLCCILAEKLREVKVNVVARLPYYQPEQKEQACDALTQTLRATESFIDEFGRKSKFRKFLSSSSIRGKFEELIAGLRDNLAMLNTTVLLDSHAVNAAIRDDTSELLTMVSDMRAELSTSRDMHSHVFAALQKLVMSGSRREELSLALTNGSTVEVGGVKLYANGQLDRFEIEFEENDDYLIGEGSFGKVYLGRFRSEKVAVKVVPIREAATHQDMDDAMKEARLLSSLNHPNIVKFHGFVPPERITNASQDASQTKFIRDGVPC